MCCLVAILVFLGPRAAIIVWWLFDMRRWSDTFTTFILPVLGFIFLPWATLAYVLVFPGGVSGLDWLWLILAFLVDIGSLTGGYGNRRRLRR